VKGKKKKPDIKVEEATEPPEEPPKEEL